MRCRKHPSDLSSAIGVCASSLRRRLMIVIAARKSETHQQPPPLSSPSSATCQQRFYNTPQIGSVTAQNKKNRDWGGLFMSLIFKSKSDRPGSSLDSSVHSCGASSSAIMPRRPKEQKSYRGMVHSDEEEHCHGGLCSNSSQAWTQTPQSVPAAMRQER